MIVGADGIHSYDVTKIPEEYFDLVLIDGPPVIISGQETRLTPLRWAAAHLKPKGSIFLDDFSRSNEQQCIKKLMTEVDDLIAISRATEKGLVELQFRSRSNSFSRG